MITFAIVSCLYYCSIVSVYTPHSIFLLGFFPNRGCTRFCVTVQWQKAAEVLNNFYEPSYESGRAVRWKIELASGDPFGIACLWDRWTDPASGKLVVSFSMLTVNADEHPVMRLFHKPGDEKRTPVVIASDLHDAWLSADTTKAAEMMTWSYMPELRAAPAPRT
jgi:putative SOS response-associated peptidase YedK